MDSHATGPTGLFSPSQSPGSSHPRVNIAPFPPSPPYTLPTQTRNLVVDRRQSTMDKTPGKPNPMMPSGATDPLEEVQGKHKVGKPSDTKVRLLLTLFPLTSPFSSNLPAAPISSRFEPLALPHKPYRQPDIHADLARLTHPAIRRRDGPRGDRGRGARLDGGQRGGPAARQHHRAGPGADRGAARDEAERGAEVRASLRWLGSGMGGSGSPGWEWPWRW